MSAKEDTIRDKLALCLELLEPGLTLIDTEFFLPNSHGAKGFIDILAKDRFGNRVIIELKRSDQAARQAMHEILKYTALFRKKEGLPFGKIRCFVVSTEWHELAVPYAEFLRVAECQCDGFLLTVNPNGSVISAKKQKPIELTEPTKLFREHSIFLFQTARSRESAIKPLSDAFRKTGGKSGFILSENYIGSNNAVIYKFAIYLAPIQISDSTNIEIRHQLNEEYGDELEGQDLDNSVEEHFQMAVMNNCENVWDDFEIGYAEKFDSTLKLGWEIERVIRLGEAPTVASVDDKEVERLISGTEGANAKNFHTVSSPRFTIQWAEIQQNAKHCLLGNIPWSRGFNWFVDSIQRGQSNSNVGISIYNPLNLPIGLFKLLVRNDSSFLPSLEITAIDSEQKSLDSLLGRIEWDGSTFPKSVDDVFTSGIGGLEMFFAAEHAGAGWELDHDLMQRHGLFYALAHATETCDGFDASAVSMVDDFGSVTYKKLKRPGKTIEEFIDSNKAYLRELVDKIGAFQVGL